MRYNPFGDLYPWAWNEEVKLLEKGAVPCWSLAALLNVLPDAMLCKDKKECALIVETIGNGPTIFGSDYIDVCYEMIVELYESNKLQKKKKREKEKNYNV